jgi:transcriptional regulator with GAF, ATPase, and Fis domain
VQGDADRSIIEVAQTFGAVARSLLAEHDMHDTLQRIVDLAAEHLEHCECAGISYIEGRSITSPASSSEVPAVVDAIQSEVDEGPCLDAIREHAVFQTGDLAKETRWPRFAHRASAETGVASILSLRLFAEENTMGALNLYSTACDAFDETDVALGAVFAVHAAVAIDAARTEQLLERKAESRDVVGQAKGILMVSKQIGEDDAFAMLRATSQRLNIKLRQVAEVVIYTGETPTV